MDADCPGRRRLTHVGALAKGAQVLAVPLRLLSEPTDAVADDLSAHGASSCFRDVAPRLPGLGRTVTGRRVAAGWCRRRLARIRSGALTGSMVVRAAVHRHPHLSVVDSAWPSLASASAGIADIGALTEDLRAVAGGSSPGPTFSLEGRRAIVPRPDVLAGGSAHLSPATWLGVCAPNTKRGAPSAIDPPPAGHWCSVDTEPRESAVLTAWATPVWCSLRTRQGRSAPGSVRSPRMVFPAHAAGRSRRPTRSGRPRPPGPTRRGGPGRGRRRPPRPAPPRGSAAARFGAGP